MSKFVKVVGFCFNNDCGFTLGKEYEVFQSEVTFRDGEYAEESMEEYVIDDHGRENYSIMNCVKIEAV